MMADSDTLQDQLSKLIQEAVGGRADEVVKAALELSRISGRTRAQTMLQNELVCRRDPTIFDVGANIGTVSAAYRQMFPDANIHAFEPHPQAFDRLAEKFHEDVKVTLNNCGMADRPGTLQFNLTNDLFSSSFLSISSTSPYVRGIGLSTVETREVVVTSIDEYCSKKGISYIDFMKLDVQGFERKVLEGAASMLGRHAIGAIQTEIVFRDFYTESSSFFDIEECLQRYGYTLRCIYDIYPTEGARIFQCDAIYAYDPEGGVAEAAEEDPNVLLATAVEHQGAGRIDDAYALYRKLLARSPGNSSLLALAGSIDLECGRNDSARELLLQANELLPENREILFRLGMAHSRLGEEDQAISCLHRLPDNGTAQLLLGQLYALAGDHGAAVVGLARAKQLGVPEADEHLALALLRAGDARGAEALLLQLVHPERKCGRWLAMMLGKLLIDQGRRDEAREYFAILARYRPELIDVALTVIADADLAEGNLAGVLEVLRPIKRSVWSRTFVCDSLARLKMLIRDSGEMPTRRPHPFPGSSAGFTVGSLDHYGRFAHQLLEYLFMRWQANVTGVVLETPDWVGHMVFELDDPLPAGPRRLVHRSNAWIEEQVARRGPQALAGLDFFSPGTFCQWQPACTELARQVFKLRPSWQVLLEPPLAMLRGGHQTLVVLHLRRTDQKRRYLLPDNHWYLEWLRREWPNLASPLLYIASDDLEDVIADFAEFSPRCAFDLPGRTVGLEWLHDFHTLMNADIAAISQSDFSYLACMLNTRARIFKQPDMANQCLSDYNPMLHNLLPVMTV